LAANTAMSQNFMPTLSKSKLIAFRQCPKRLWLEVHRTDLREDSPQTQARFEVGYQVGDIAKRIYDPEGIGAVIDFKTEGFKGAFDRTKVLVANFRQPVFEAGFKAAGALAFADVLLPASENGQPVWRMVEVKSATGVHDYHRDDIAVQTFVAKEAGVPLKSVALAHIDSSWVCPGGLCRGGRDVWRSWPSVPGTWWASRKPAGSRVLSPMCRASSVHPTSNSGGRRSSGRAFCSSRSSCPLAPLDTVPEDFG